MVKTHVAGIDVHKEVLAITVLIGPEPAVHQFECSTFTEDLIKCGQKLLDLGVKELAMESTGVYWKAPFNVWAPMGFEVTLGQASHMKTVPGRKTDMNDSHWIATLHRYGLIRASFIPEGEFQRLRLLSRHRVNLVEDLARVKNRIQKVLEDGNIKLGVIASDVFGKSGIQVVELIAKGVTDAQRLADQIYTNLKRRDEAKKALTNYLTKEHCYLVNSLYSQYKFLTQEILNLESELKLKTEKYSHLIEELKKIPGISDVLAMSILAETSDSVSKFKDEGKFAAWTGVAAGNNESGGKKKDQNVDKETLHSENC